MNSKFIVSWNTPTPFQPKARFWVHRSTMKVAMEMAFSLMACCRLNVMVHPTETQPAQVFRKPKQKGPK